MPIDPTPSNDKFPEPIAGQPIPRGWFGRLVRFINSLILRGDRQYFAVTHSMSGTTIAPSKAMIDALQRAAGAAPAAGGSAPQDLSASVTGGTASVTLSGSTSAVEFVGTGSVTITGNTSGQIVLSGEFPLPVRPVSIGFNGSHVMVNNGWAYMACTIGSYGNSSDSAFAYLRTIRNNNIKDYLVAVCGLLTTEGGSGGSLFIPVAAGTTVCAFFDLPQDGNYYV